MTDTPKNESDDQKRDTVLRRMLETPPKAHVDKDASKPADKKTPDK